MEDDRDIEALLARYKPIDPRDELTARIRSGAIARLQHLEDGPPRTWPWAVAAAALFAVTLTLYGSSSRAASDPEAAAISREISDLTVVLGGDEVARESAVILVLSERERAAKLQ
jgi:hypothetical protein